MLKCSPILRMILENAEVNLNDKSLKVIYNASAYEQEKDEKLRAFLHFISTNEPGKDDFSNRLSELVKLTKENEKFRSDYAAMNLHDRDIMRAAKKEGHEEGVQQKVMETAANALKLKLPIEQISQITGLPLEQISELSKKIKPESVEE